MEVPSKNIISRIGNRGCRQWHKNHAGRPRVGRRKEIGQGQRKSDVPNIILNGIYAARVAAGVRNCQGDVEQAMSNP